MMVGNIKECGFKAPKKGKKEYGIVYVPKYKEEQTQYSIT